MRDILCWGLIKSEFDRLKIKPKCTYRGFGWSDEDVMYVYQVTDEEFEVLCKDDEEYKENYRTSENWNSAVWRWSNGSNQMYNPTKRITVNGKYMIGWNCNENCCYTYTHVLEYLCDHVGASTESNVTSCLVDLAKMNDLSFGEFMKKYQG